MAAGLVLATSFPAFASEERVTLTGTYRRMAKEVVEGGTVRHAYDDLLVSGARSYRLRMRAGRRPRPGSTVRISANTTGTGEYDVGSVRTTAAESRPPMGPTRTLAILAYWTAPDSVTPSRVSSQLFGDDNGWIREASYGSATLSGAVTPWLRIQAPTNGRCYDYAHEILTRARAAAGNAGFAHTGYDRTLVYFPKCTGTDTANLTGWAYEPGDAIWLNGVMDRRTSVHEHGHSFGLGHGRAYACTTNGVRVTLGTSCTRSEYGDPFDAMGQSVYAGHFSAPHKDRLGWMGSRTRLLTTSSATFTLAPFERPSTAPLAAHVLSPVAGRQYWLEFRQPVGYDANLPAGGTAGVLIHIVDPAIGEGPYLLDASPGDGSFASSVLGPGRTWAAPDGVRITVNSVSTSGASVSVSGAKPAPTAPGVPRSVTATPGDHRARVSWLPPSSLGNAELEHYAVTATNGSDTRNVSVPPGETSTLLTSLRNDTAYTFTVRAVNAAGAGPAATATATPRMSLPTVSITSPADGATVEGVVSVHAVARAGANSLSEITNVTWQVDDGMSGWAELAPGEEYVLDTTVLANGEHTVTVFARDENWREAVTTVTYVVRNLTPSVTFTSPAAGATLSGTTALLTATATPAEDGAAIAYVEFFDPYSPGRQYGAKDTTAPYEVPWDITHVYDTDYTIAARVVDTHGRVAITGTRQVRVQHAPPSISAMTPAHGAVVRGTSLTVAAEVAPGTPGVDIRYVQFSDGSTWVNDLSAPYEATFDTSGLRGTRYYSVTAHEASGRVATRNHYVTIDNPLPSLTATTGPSYTVTTRTVTMSGTAAPVAGGAPIARVEVSTHYRTLHVVPRADGTWSVPWDLTGRQGYNYVKAVAVDTAGYRRSVEWSFYSERPGPSVAMQAPVSDGPVSYNTPLDLVATVKPHDAAWAPIESVCFRAVGRVVACGTRQEDGTTYVARGVLLPYGEYVHVQPTLTETDGYVRDHPGHTLHVYGPPFAPNGVTANPTDDARVVVSWFGSSTAARPVREWVVRDSATGDVVGTARPSASSVVVDAARFAGTARTYTVEGVNDYATSARTPSDPVVPQWSIALADVTVTPSVVTYPAKVTVSARIVRADGAAVAGLPLHVELRLTADPERELLYVTGASSSTGWVTYSLTPQAGVAVRLIVPERAAYREYRSDFVKVVEVKARVEGAFTNGSIPLGRSTGFNGGVRPPMPGRGVALQRYYDGGWHTVATRYQDSLGRVSFPLTPRTRGKFTYRLAYGGDAYRTAGVSVSRTLTVY